MKKSLLVLAIAITLTSARPDRPAFTGKIKYTFTFSDLLGNDITDRMATMLGREQHYYVNDSNYKSYDESQNITQLYNGRTNTYYGFWKDKTALQIDALTRTSQQYSITKLDKTVTILGYECTAIQVETDELTSVYYYSPLLRIDQKAYLKHNFGDLNRYLEATNGALALRYVITNHKKGYVWTIHATKITKLPLRSGDFEYPVGYILKN
jgi:hypothetical protein